MYNGNKNNDENLMDDLKKQIQDAENDIQDVLGPIDRNTTNKHIVIAIFQEFPDIYEHVNKCVDTIEEFNMDPRDLLIGFIANFIDKECLIVKEKPSLEKTIDKDKLVTNNHRLIKRAMTWLKYQYMMYGYEWISNTCKIPRSALYSEHNFNNFIEKFESDKGERIKL